MKCIITWDDGSCRCPVHALADERTLHLPHSARAAYLQTVLVVVRLARVFVLVLVASFSVMLVIGVGTPETGVIEKVVLLALLAICLVLAAKVSTLATRASTRLQRR
jgi:hypothetical protein